MDGRRRLRVRMLVATGAALGAALSAQLVLATFTTTATVVADPGATARVELTLDASGAAQLSAAVTDMLPGDVRESLVVVTPSAGSTDLGDLAYQVTGALVADESPASADPTATNVLAEPATRALAVEVRECSTGSTFRARTVNDPVAGATDVYCDRDAAGTPGAYDDGDTDGALIGSTIDPTDGSARPLTPLALSSEPVSTSGARFNIRVVFVDNGEQNDLQHETFTLTHTFSAGPARDAGNV